MNDVMFDLSALSRFVLVLQYRASSRCIMIGAIIGVGMWGLLQGDG